MRKGYLTPPVLIILALICLFVAAALLFNTELLKSIKQTSSSPTSSTQSSSKSATDETASWKTFVDPAARYSLKFPDDWDAKEVNSTKIILEKGDNQTDEVGKIEISNLGKINKDAEALAVEKSKNTQLRVVISNFNIKGFVGSEVPDLYNNIIYLYVRSNEGEIFFFQLNNYKYKDLFNQILSTFKFLD